MDFKKRIETLNSMYPTEYLTKIFRHIRETFDAMHRLEGGQTSYFVDYLRRESDRTIDFSPTKTLANDIFGYDCIKVLAVLTHPCQKCAEDPDACHTRPGFCEHKQR